MFKDEFVRLLLAICAIALFFYLIQPGFLSRHPGLVSFFSLPGQNSGVAQTKGPGDKISSGSSSGKYFGTVRVVNVSLSFASAEQSLLLGVSGEAVNFKNWKIKTSLGSFTLPSISVPPGATLLITSASSSIQTGAQKAVYVGQSFLSRSDNIEITDPYGKLVERYSY